MINRTLAGVLVAVATLAGVGVYADSCYRDDVEASRQRAEALKNEADAQRGVARTWRLAYDVAAAQIAAQAAKAHTQDARLRDRIRVVRDTTPIPDTCRVVVAQRDSLIDDAVAQGETWRDLFEKQQSATADLRQGYDTLAVGYDTLSKAYGILAHPPRRNLLSMLLHPRISPAAFAGLCTNGKPCVGAGFALTFGRQR